jgi:hypothetical protein
LTSGPARDDDDRATSVNAAPERQAVKITFLGKVSTPNDSPTLYETDKGTLLVQGYIVTDPEALANMRVPDGETVVEVPKQLMEYLPPDVLKRLSTLPEGTDAEGDG